MNRLRIVTVIALVLLSSTAARAQEGENTAIAPGIAFTPKGVIVIDDGSVTAEVTHFGIGWAMSLQHEDRFTVTSGPEVTNTSFRLEGLLKTVLGNVELSEHAESSDEGVRYTNLATLVKTVQSDKMVFETNLLTVEYKLPVDFYQGKQVIIDGQPLTLPDEPPANTESPPLRPAAPAKQVELPTPNGTLTIRGDLDVAVQDNRAWNETIYAMRLNFSPPSGMPLTESQVEFVLDWQESDQAAASDDAAEADAAESADAPDAAETEAAE